MPFGNPNVWDEDFNAYVHAAFIADASGGAVVDSQSRTALNAVLAVLRSARITGFDAGSTVQPQVAGPTVYDGTRNYYTWSAAIVDPSGGATVDTQLRTATVQILTACRQGGLIVGGTAGGPNNWDEDTSSWSFSQYTSPSGGGTIDVEGRVACDLIGTALKSAGYLAQD